MTGRQVAEAEHRDRSFDERNAVIVSEKVFLLRYTSKVSRFD
jgi:hypothetical protein